MTPYEQGFLRKCAELGVDRRVAGYMLKLAFDPDLPQAEEEYRRQHGTEPPDDWYVQRAVNNGRRAWKAMDERLSGVGTAASGAAQQGQQAVQSGQTLVQQKALDPNDPFAGQGTTSPRIGQPKACPTCGQPMPIAKAAYDSLLKRAESSDPNLQRASEIFKDWLTTKKHTVRSGEILSGIARKYNVPMEEIMKENNMTSVLGIKPGQQIKIPVDLTHGKK